MTHKGERWSKKETRKLKSNWPDHTAEEIADMLPGRTTEAVESKAQRLNEKGELPEKNRSKSYSNSSHSTSKHQIEKAGSQVRQVSGMISKVKRDTPRGMDAENGIGMKINGEWYYDTYSPSQFEDSSHGIAFSHQGFTVELAKLSGADYTVEDSGRGKSYNRLQSYGTISKNHALEISQIENWDKRPGRGTDWVNRHPTMTSKFGKPMNRGSIEVVDHGGTWYLFISRGVFEDGEWVGKERESKEYSSRDEAVSEAKEWMRNHPKGGMIRKKIERPEDRIKN